MIHQHYFKSNVKPRCFCIEVNPFHLDGFSFACHQPKYCLSHPHFNDHERVKVFDLNGITDFCIGLTHTAVKVITG